VEDLSGNYDLSEGLIEDGGDWTVPSGLNGNNCVLWFENIGGGQDGYIDIYYELNPPPTPSPTGIPGYNLFFLLGIFLVITILITKKVKKT